MILWRVALLFSLILCIGCSTAYKQKSSKAPLVQSEDNTSQQFQILAKQKYRDEIHYSFNSSNSAVLCIKGAKGNRETSLSFFLYSLSDERVLLDEVLPVAEVSWLDDERIRVKTVPGIVRGDEAGDRQSNVYVYNIRLRSKENPTIKDADK